MLVFCNTSIPAGTHSLCEYFVADILYNVLKVQVFYVEIEKNVKKSFYTLPRCKSVEQERSIVSLCSCGCKESFIGTERVPNS